jgi:hypothetical protein
MAEGLAFVRLYVEDSISTVNEHEGRRGSHPPSNCQPFPGVSRWIVHPYPSGKGVVPSSMTQRWLSSCALSS